METSEAFTRQGHEMEHFNIGVFFSCKIPPNMRPEPVLEFVKIFAPFFGNVDEVCRNNYITGTSSCVKWPAGKSLLESPIEEGELLFIYGTNCQRIPDSRSSVHIEEGLVGTVFLVSLFPRRDFSELDIGKYMLETNDVAARFSDSYVVAAGGEFEFETSEDATVAVRECFTDTSLCSWLVAPSHIVPNWPKSYTKLGESGQAVLLRKNERPSGGF